MKVIMPCIYAREIMHVPPIAMVSLVRDGAHLILAVSHGPGKLSHFPNIKQECSNELWVFESNSRDNKQLIRLT